MRASHYLDEHRHKQCQDALRKDGMLKYLQKALTNLLQTAIPLFVRVNQDTNEAEYVYSPEVSELKEKLETQIQDREKEITEHFKIRPYGKDT